ncbi:MAG: histidine kinase [Candidatus Zixiibacteriota bacterium]|nr:MAG: histidine kinase [candidate division Zixibacteria bacterium]
MSHKQPTDRLLKYESKFLNFDTLMQFRVKHILLVSSSYDSYVLEEDGQLTDLIYNEYLELNLTITPHVKRASTAKEALEILKTQSIDLVLIFKRVSDIDVLAFGREVKKLTPGMPVILLAYHERELAPMLTEDYSSVIDQIFVWTGDVRILLSIIKLIEDRINVEHDTGRVGVRVIIIVEDSVRFYSSYLPLLYREIMQQTRELMAEGLNISHKILRMRARPKILLARTYEQAWELFTKYRKYLLAIISDFRFKMKGQTDDEAGIKLINRIRSEIPDIPVLMQSSGMMNAETARKHNVGFLYKRSPTLHADLRSFILTHFGFGDFVFIDPQTRQRLCVAGDFKSMERCLEMVDDQSLVYHANRNHFSNWLMARTEFDLAAQIRPRKVSEFKDVEALRRYLISTFKEFRREKALGVITDFTRSQFDQQSEFVRLGGGSLGGKGRGLAFVNALLHRFKLSDMFEGVTISVPKSFILGTDVFDEFMQDNDLIGTALGDHSDEQITDRFVKAKLPRQIVDDLDAFLETATYPLAIRSSSMLEDSHLQTFAGIYDTHMLPNNHLKRKVRLQQVEKAIKLIYASTFFNNARAYHEAAGNRVEEEKMAVILQQAVGRQYHKRFYPTFSGVALSHNYYSIDGVDPEDGVVYTALGLGKTIVEGGNCLRFSPSYPNKLPQMSTVKDMLRNSQHDFFAIDLTRPDVELHARGDDSLIRCELSVAELDGTLQALCSTHSAENDRVYDGCSRRGVRIVTFAPILKLSTFPLTDIVKFLLRLGSEGLNCPVEIEFAVDLDTPVGTPKNFYFLQVRPMIKDTPFETISIDSVPDERVIARSEKTLGSMRLRSIRDIIMVRPDTFKRSDTLSIAGQIGQFNDKLSSEERPYLLVGPGRWGTSERWLGIPVAWSQISGARIIVEAAYGDFAPDPSFGTHFFQNLTSFRVGYLTVNPAINNGFMDFDWLAGQKVTAQSDYVAHIQLDEPLDILIDGRVGKAVIAR